MATLGEIVRQLRKSKGLTLSELADSVEGYDAGNLSRFETNKQEIAQDKLKLIANALNTTVGDIYNLSEGKPVVALKQEVAQYNIKDFSKYTDNMNIKEREQFDDLLANYVVLSVDDKKLISDFVNTLYKNDTKIKSLMRLRSREKHLSEATTNDGRTVTKKA